MFAGGSRSRARRAARVLYQQPAQVASEEVRILIATLEDLIRRVGLAADPELKRLRKQSETALANAKAALAQGGTQLRERLTDVSEQGRQYVRRRPLVSLGMVAVGMMLIGLVAGRSITRD